LRFRLWDLRSLFPQNPFPQYLDRDNSDWQLTQALIRAIRDESESHGARFLLVLLPQREYLNGMYDPVIYQSLEQFAQRADIDYINLMPLMRSHRWGDVFYPEDGHFKPLGARIAAELIYRKLQNTDDR